MHQLRIGFAVMGMPSRDATELAHVDFQSQSTRKVFQAEAFNAPISDMSTHPPALLFRFPGSIGMYQTCFQLESSLDEPTTLRRWVLMLWVPLVPSRWPPWPTVRKGADPSNVSAHYSWLSPLKESLSLCVCLSVCLYVCMYVCQTYPRTQTYTHTNVHTAYIYIYIYIHMH